MGTLTDSYILNAILKENRLKTICSTYAEVPPYTSSGPKWSIYHNKRSFVGYPEGVHVYNHRWHFWYEYSKAQCFDFSGTCQIGGYIIDTGSLHLGTKHIKFLNVTRDTTIQMPNLNWTENEFTAEVNLSPGMLEGFRAVNINNDKFVLIGSRGGYSIDDK